MIIIAKSLFIRQSSLPKSVQPVYSEMAKAMNHAFESQEEFLRYVAGLESWIRELSGNGKARLSLRHTSSEEGGELTVFRPGSGYGDLLRLGYIRLFGHIVVSLDGRTLHCHPFINEKGE